MPEEHMLSDSLFQAVFWERIKDQYDVQEIFSRELMWLKTGYKPLGKTQGVVLKFL